MLKPLNIIAAICSVFFILPLAAKDKKQAKPVAVKVAPQKLPTKKAARNWLNQQLKFIQEATDDIRKLPDKASDKKYVKTFLNRYDPNNEKSVYNKLIPKIYIPANDYMSLKKKNSQKLDEAKEQLNQAIHHIPRGTITDLQLQKVIDSIEKNIALTIHDFPWEETYFRETYYIIKRKANISDDDDPDIYEFNTSRHSRRATKVPYVVRGKKRGTQDMAEEWVEGELRLMQCTLEKIRLIRDIPDLKDHLKSLLDLYGVRDRGNTKPYILPALEGEYLKAQQKHAAELKKVRAELSEELTRIRELEFHHNDLMSALRLISVFCTHYDRPNWYCLGGDASDEPDEFDLSEIHFHANEATIDKWIREKIHVDKVIITALKEVQTPEQTKAAVISITCYASTWSMWYPDVREIPTWDDYNQVAKKYDTELNAIKTELPRELERVKKWGANDPDFLALVTYLRRYYEYGEKYSASFDSEKYLEQETEHLQQIINTLMVITDQESLEKNYENLLDLCGLKNHQIPDAPTFIPIGDQFANAAKNYNRRIHRLMRCYLAEDSRIRDLRDKSALPHDHDLWHVMEYLNQYIDTFMNNTMYYKIENGEIGHGENTPDDEIENEETEES